MSNPSPQNAGESRGILSWFGRSAEPRPTSTPDASQSAPAPEEDPREKRRRQLLTDITSFIMRHRLEISAYTLSIAFDVITGADQKLANEIEARVAAREPISLDWLKDVARGSGHSDGSAMLDALMAKLESSLTDFTETATAARSATSDYSTALEAHVGDLEQVGKAGVVISELASIAKVMLARTREIEAEMSRSEAQTKMLQASLDDARRKAEMDHLTGLPNRRAFESVLEKELVGVKESGEPLCVAFVDIDHFKKINDTHGHDAGDRVLKAVAQTLAKISDDKCHVARHGGEEFVALIRGKTLEEAWQVLDGAREAMAARRLINRATDMPFGKVTFSGGVADVFAYPTPSEAMKAADDSLYIAKAQGRNCIVYAEASGSRAAA